MAILMANPDGTSNAKSGDYVVTGGGIYLKTDNGSVKIGGIDTASGTSKNFSDVVDTFNRLTGGARGPVNKPDPTSPPVQIPQRTQPKPSDLTGDTEIHDSQENYDDFTLPLSYDYSGSSGSASSTLSNVVGYAVVGLVLLVVADRLMGK